MEVLLDFMTCNWHESPAVLESLELCRVHQMHPQVKLSSALNLSEFLFRTNLFSLILLYIMSLGCQVFKTICYLSHEKEKVQGGLFSPFPLLVSPLISSPPPSGHCGFRLRIVYLLGKCFTTWVIPPKLFTLVIFQVRTCAFGQGWPWISIQLLYGSHMAGIIGIQQHIPFLSLIESCQLFCFSQSQTMIILSVLPSSLLALQ